MNYKNLFYFDIETTGKHKTIEDFETNDKRGYELFLRKLERKSDNILDWKKSPDIVFREKSSLMPEFGKIVCVTMSFYKNDELKTKSVYNDNERTLVNEVHKIFKNISDNTTFGLCGYYIKGFDIPWINRKMLKYGLEIPRLLKTFGIKPWDMNIFDLAEIWRNSGTLETTSFDEMLYELGLESPKTIMKGNEVHQMYWDGQIDKVVKYCELDVKSCVEAAKTICELV